MRRRELTKTYFLKGIMTQMYKNVCKSSSTKVFSTALFVIEKDGK